MNLRNLKIPHVEKISISYIFFLSTLIVRAQKYKLLTGYVFDSEIPISNIHVINTSRGNAEVTDINGLFEISVSIGEILVFSSIQYEKYELIITENIFSSKEITIYLKGFVNELDEVIVTNNSLTGNLKYDLLESGLEEKQNFEKAATFRNQINALNNIISSQNINYHKYYYKISIYFKILNLKQTIKNS